MRQASPSSSLAPLNNANDLFIKAELGKYPQVFLNHMEKILKLPPQENDLLLGITFVIKQGNVCFSMTLGIVKDKKTNMVLSGPNNVISSYDKIYHKDKIFADRKMEKVLNEFLLNTQCPIEVSPNLDIKSFVLQSIMDKIQGLNVNLTPEQSSSVRLILEDKVFNHENEELSLSAFWGNYKQHYDAVKDKIILESSIKDTSNLALNDKVVKI